MCSSPQSPVAALLLGTELGSFGFQRGNRAGLGCCTELWRCHPKNNLWSQARLPGLKLGPTAWARQLNTSETYKINQLDQGNIQGTQAKESIVGVTFWRRIIVAADQAVTVNVVSVFPYWPLFSFFSLFFPLCEKVCTSWKGFHVLWNATWNHWIFVTQRICPVYTGKEQPLKLGFEPGTNNPKVWGSPACTWFSLLWDEKYSLCVLFSTGEVPNPWVRYTCVVQLWGHKQLCCVCDLCVGWLGWGQDAAASPQRALLLGRLCLSPHKRAALD